MDRKIFGIYLYLKIPKNNIFIKFIKIQINILQKYINI